MTREPNLLMLVGGAENLTYFTDHAAFADEQWFWTVIKAAAKGDTALVYLIAPVSRVVGRVKLIESPFYNVGGMFDNPKMLNKWCAEIGEVECFIERPELTIAGLRSLFPEWPWTSQPRGNTTVPPGIRPALNELLEDSILAPNQPVSNRPAQHRRPRRK